MSQAPNRLKPFYENIEFENNDGKMILNFGPQHPSAHGQLRLVLELDGERVVRAMPEVGFMHRGIEKMAENMTYQEFIPVTDRIDYVAATATNYVFCEAVERLCGIKAPRRAQIIRVMLLELNRISSHLLFLATHALDIGAMSVFLYAFREREYLLDLMEKYCGARLTHSSVRIGGMPLDLPDGWLDEMVKFCEAMPAAIDMYEKLLSENRIWKMRLEDVGVLSREQALNFGCTGVMARASGVEWDLRKEQPYLVYNELEFDVPVAKNGDSYARYTLYMREMRESVKILLQCQKLYQGSSPEILASAPEFVSAPKEQIMTQNYSLMQHFVLITQGIRPPKGEIYFASESPKGELGVFLHSTGEASPYRLKFRAPSFFHCALYEELLTGAYVADVATIIGSTNIILGEVDR